ncbi:ATP-binding cassette domain-containing protein [candidate division CSSED10-310 bacterium]|uniref:ATP-binding cassette domain-containing protein n=1 Tax=candidate division CSSED10-310 bacterium TaxID=2855610 RepID=A0ABV6Z2W3_UNCC1
MITLREVYHIIINKVKKVGLTPDLLSLEMSLARGKIYGLIGVNGSGKTTTLKMILGLLAPTRGSISVFGYNPLEFPPILKNKIGYVAERHPLYPEMTISQIGDYQSNFFSNWSQETFETLAYFFDLKLDNIIGKISNGERAQVYLALVIAQQPELLIMDDPTLDFSSILTYY